MRAYKGGDRGVVQVGAGICVGHSATVTSVEPGTGVSDFFMTLKCDCGRDLLLGKASSVGEVFGSDLTPFEIDVAESQWRKFFNV